MLIIFAFDPLAVALTLGVNHAILQRKKNMGGHVEHSLEIVEHMLSDEENSEPALKDIHPTANISTDELKAVLAEMQNKELTSAEMAQMGMLEEMLERKMVTEKIRNPNKNS